MEENDFITFSSSSKLAPNISSRQQSSSISYDDSYPFIIEKKDGTISEHTLQLGKSPYQIIEQLANAINFQSPPPSLKISRPFDDEHKSTYKSQSNQNDIETWMQGFGNYQYKSPSSLNRDILHFLKQVDFNDIKQRKLDRINATAAALVARRAFQFSSIDGTRLGWSSASLAICLSSLTALHEEHESKLISSFYPFHLKLSGDEFQNKVDLYAGVIRLNPAATQLQWLGIMSEVSHSNVITLKNNLKELKRNQSEVEHALGLRVIKGHTCGSEEYHKCMKRLAMEISQKNSSGNEDKSALTISNNKTKLVIESSQTCRRGRLRKHDGSFEVGASMNSMQVFSIIGKFASTSNKIIEEQSKHQERCKELINKVMYTYGVEKIKQVSSTVTSEQMSQVLSILLNKNEAEQRELRGYLAGQSIGIVGRGQLCCLGDDGSIHVPTNCS